MCIEVEIVVRKINIKINNGFREGRKEGRKEGKKKPIEHISNHLELLFRRGHLLGQSWLGLAES